MKLKNVGVVKSAKGILSFLCHRALQLLMMKLICGIKSQSLLKRAMKLS